MSDRHPHAGDTSRHAAWAAAGASVLFGASVVATRYVVPQTTPVVLAFLRYVLATLCLLVVMRRAAFPAMPWRDRVQVTLLGVLFFGVFFFMNFQTDRLFVFFYDFKGASIRSH